jgi:hypothetical protein
MSTTTTRTAGQIAAAELCRYFSIGPRTRRYRDGADLHDSMIEALGLAATCPGYYSDRTHEALAGSYGVHLAWRKHVDGYRIDGTTRHHLTSLSPWKLARVLGEMIDAGVQCTGDGERFFADYRRRVA